MTRLGSAGQEITEVSVLELGTGPGASGVTELGAQAAGAAAALAPTLPAAVGQTTWLSGFSVDGLGATAGSVIAVTVTGLLGGTRTYEVTIPAGALLALAPRLQIEFTRPLPASAPNTAIVLNVPSFGVGNTSAVAELHGFRK